MKKKINTENIKFDRDHIVKVFEKNVITQGAHIQEVPLREIKIEENIRKEYTNIEELAKSIIEKGLLQPITVTKGDDGFYDIVFGHRRYKAFCHLNTKDPNNFLKINAIVKEKDTFSKDDIFEVQLIENIQREDLSPLELKGAYEQLKSKGLSYKQIADKLNKSEGYIKHIFSSLKVIKSNSAIEGLMKSDASITLADIQEIRILPFKEQLQLITEKINGTIKTREELRERVREIRDKLYNTNHDTHVKKKTFDVFSSNNGRIKVRSFIYDPKNSSKADTVKLLTSLKGLVKTLEEAAQ